MPVVPLRVEHAEAVARLHAGALAGDFLPSLGPAFLSVFYRTALERGQLFGFVQLEAGQVAGFVAASLATSRLFRSVLGGAALQLGWAALPAVLRRPGLLLKAAETVLYPAREAQASVVEAELLVIAVAAEKRGCGIGEALVRSLNAAFRAQGVPVYKVTVLETNPGANRFYRRLGFQLSGTFRMYGKGWNLYTFPLAEVQD